MGDACPIPVVKTLRALKELNGAGTVQTLVDNRAAVENLTRLAESKGCAIETERLGEKEYRVTITAGEDAELRAVPMASALFPPRRTTPWWPYLPATWARATRCCSGVPVCRGG